MQEASGQPYRNTARPEKCRWWYLPALPQEGYALLPNKNISSAFDLFRLTWSGWDGTLESEGRAIRVGRVVVVHLPVVVDIHKVGRVASISRGQPPVVATVENGFAEHNPLTARGLTRRVRFIRFLDDFRAVSPRTNQHVSPVNQVPGLFELCRHRMVRVDFPVVELR